MIEDLTQHDLDNPEVAELADTLWNATTTTEWHRGTIIVAKHLHTEGYRKVPTILTADELDALPVDSVVVDIYGTPRMKRRADSVMGAGWTNAGRSPLSARELADGRPMHVVYVPNR